MPHMPPAAHPRRLRRTLAALLALTATLTPLPAHAAEPAPTQSAASQDLAGWLAGQAESEALSNILPWWLTHAPAAGRSGFNGEIMNDLTVTPDAPRGAILTARILWTFSAAWRIHGDPACRTMADRAFEDLSRNFIDRRHGGVRWMIRADGRPLDEQKHVYAQAFAVYALAEYYRATGERPALDLAIAIHQLVERHARDTRHGGYFETFSRDWRTRPASELNPMGPIAPKSQNVHLHILEAWSSLLRVWRNPDLQAAHRALLEVMLDRMVHPSTHHLRLLFEADWTPASDGISYGHDIEFAWLATEAASLIGDPVLFERVRATALRIADVTAAEGIDADGGVLYEAGPEGIRSGTKDGWVQAEAAVGFANAWRLSGDPRYLRLAADRWNFIERHVIDRRHGEWFYSLARDLTVDASRPKAGAWKCPYHNSRACFELTALLRTRTGDGELRPLPH